MLWIALAGHLFGFVGSIPVAGPVAVLVVSRGLDGRCREGILIGLGAAVTEAIYAFLAYRGFSAYLADVPLVAHASRAAAVVLLATVGILLLRRGSGEIAARPETRQAGSFALGFTVSALNPTLIVTWTALVGLVASAGVLDVRPFAAGVFATGVGLGIASWFVVAVWLVDRFRARVSDAAIARTHVVFGWLVVLLAFALLITFALGLAGA